MITSVVNMFVGISLFTLSSPSTFLVITDIALLAEMDVSFGVVPLKIISSDDYASWRELWVVYFL